MGRTAVEDDRRRRCLATDPLAIGHDESGVDRLEQAAVAPRRKPAEGGALRRQIIRQQTPRDPAAQHLEDRIEHVAQRPLPRTPEPVGRRKSQGCSLAPVPVLRSGDAAGTCEGRSLLVVGHANSLRALVMALEGMSHEEVETLEIASAEAFIYDLDTSGIVRRRHGRADTVR